MRKYLLISFIFVFFFLISCSKEEKKEVPSKEESYIGVSNLTLPAYKEKQPERGGIFRRGIPAEPVTLNPLIASDFTSYLVYKWIFDPLFDMDKDMHLIPVLVESYKFSEDGLKLVLNLKKNVKWHDGVEFTADDVIFTFDAVNDKSVEAINKRAIFSKIKNYRKIDKYAIEIEYFEKYSPALYELVFYIIPKHIYDYKRGEGDFLNKHPKNFEPIGNGPYVFQSWKRGDSIVLSANQDYHNGAPYIDKLVFKVMTSLETEYSAFLTDSIDLTRLSPELFEKVKMDKNFQKKAYILEYPSRNYFYIGWNQDGTNPFFINKNIRRALTMSLNIDGFVKKVLKGHAILCTGPFYPDSEFCAEEIKPIPYDPEKAKEILKAEGLYDSNGNGIIDKEGIEFEFEIIYAQEAKDYQRYLEFFQNDLRKVGILMNLRPLEWSTFLKRTNSHKFEAFLTGFSYGDDPNPYMMFHSSMAQLLPSGESVGENLVSYKNSELDKLIEEQLRETDFEKRRFLLKKIHKIIYEDQPYTFLVVPNNIAALNKKFQNVDVSQKGYGIFAFYGALLKWWVPKELR